jgi:hypothetical protein
MENFIRPVMCYGTECWVIWKQRVHQMCIAEMKMLRWMSGNAKKDRIRMKTFT